MGGISIDIDSYLNRLKLKREKPSFSFLRLLHKQHILNIPFENLDIQYGKRIILNISQIENKILNSKRGGYCYELNGLFFHLLEGLGFRCKIYSARHFLEENRYSRPFDHMVIIVKLEEGIFLADVGMIDGFQTPIWLKENHPQLDFNKYFRTIKNIDNHWILQESIDALHFKSIYILDIGEKKLIQFLEANDFQQDNERSFFRENKIVSRLTENGRIILTNRELTLKLNGETEVFEINSENEFLSKLDQYFQINYKDLI